jgi:putative PIN family toxin of toxin-antitoxin system
LRVFLDTNVLVAAFATRGLCADVVRTVLAEHELVLGEVVLEEFRRALSKKLKLPADRIRAAEAVFEGIPLVPKPKKASSLKIRDSSDRWILASAEAGGADVLVTGDEDLLSVAGEALVRISSPRAFWELLRTGSR